MPDLALNPFPSERCRAGAGFEPITGYDLCNTDGEHRSYPDWLHRPDLADRAVIGGRSYDDYGTTPGFGPGMALLPYVLDWGDYVAAITRRRMHVTILKAFPRREDRATALINAPRYVDKKDTCIPPMTGNLILARPFVGYSWDANALRRWLDYVEIDPQCKGYPTGLEPNQATALAVSWLVNAELAWKLLTTEVFPYTERDIVRLWL